MIVVYCIREVLQPVYMTEVIVSQQSKTIIPLPGDDGLGEENILSAEACLGDETKPGFHKLHEESREVEREPDQYSMLT